MRAPFSVVLVTCNDRCDQSQPEHHSESSSGPEVDAFESIGCPNGEKVIFTKGALWRS